MPQARRKLPTYRHHKATGQAVVTLGGRDFYLGTFDSAESRQRYDRLIAEWLSNGRRALQTDKPSDITILELVDRFWQHAQEHYGKPGSTTGFSTDSEAENYRLVLKPLKDLYGLTKAGEFGPCSLKAVRHRMIQLGWCRNVVNRQTGRLKHVFAWAVSQELIPAAVHQALLTVQGLRKGKSEARETAPVKPVPEAHIEAVLPFLPPTIQAMVDLQLLTGMRSTEVCIMRTCDIDRSGEVWIYRPQFHKTQHHGDDHTREVWLGPKAQALLQPLLKLDLQAYLFDPRDAAAWRCSRARGHRRPNQKPNPKQTERAVGERYDKDSYARAIVRACDLAFAPPAALARQRVWSGKGEGATRWETRNEWKARLGVEKWAELRTWRSEHRWHPHQLRHNAGTRIRKEFGIEVARIILGHKSAVVTEVYAEADAEKARAIMAKVG